MKTTSLTRAWLIAGASVAALSTAAPALAQDNKPVAAPEEPTTLLEAVVVTAEKRSQNVQDIPVAVSAYTDKVRENVGIQNVQDLTNFTPGMTYTTGNDRVSLRGISRFTNNRSSEGGVAIYSDGIYTSSTTAGNLSTLFIDRTEVLRGPQGTLYGRNSVGGAVNFISKRPTKDLSGEVRVGYQNYNRLDVEGAVSGPINDHLRYRFVGSWSDQQKGYLRNVYDGSTEGGKGRQGVAEAQFAGDFLDGKIDWWVKAQGVWWENYGRGPGGRNTYTLGAYETTPLVPSGQIPSGTYLYTGTRPENVNHRWFDADDPNKIALNFHEYTAETVFHANGFDIKYLGGYKFYNYNLQTDVDDTSRSAPYTALGKTVYPRRNAQYREDPWWYSNEINITSTGDGPTQWIAGLYQFREGSNYAGVDARAPDQASFATPTWTVYSFSPLTVVPASVQPVAANPERRYAFYGTDNVTWSQAVFAQAEHKLGEHFVIRGGLRYTWDRRKSYESTRILCYLGSACNFLPGLPVADITPIAVAQNSTDPSVVVPYSYDISTGYAHRGLKNNWSALTGTAGIDYKPDEDSLYYAKYTRGYKAGGFNAGTITANPSTKPEFINAYELGAKKTFGGRLQANASLFYYDYTDVQVPLSEVTSAGLTITNFYNLPKTTSKGFEIETIWFPTDKLQILANYAYLDAKINKACCFSDPNDLSAYQPGAVPGTATRLPPVNGVDPSLGQDLAGQRFPNSNPHRVTINANYTWKVFGGDLTGSASYIWRSSAYSSQFNRWYNKIDAWGQADARLVWRSGERDWTVIGFVKNITDEEGPVSHSGTRSNTAPPAGSPYAILNETYTFNQPRTFGVEIQRKF